MNAHSMIAAVGDYCKRHQHPLLEVRHVLESSGTEDFAAHIIAEAVAFGLHLPVDDADFTLQELFKAAALAEQATIALLGIE